MRGQIYTIKNNKGFTIIEVLVGSFILVIMSILVWKFQSDVFALNKDLQGKINTQQEVRQFFKTMSAEIRSASPSSTGSYSLVEVNNNSFIFYSDNDGDGLKEKIKYFLDGSVLKKGTLKPSGNPLSYNPANEKVISVVSGIANGATPIFTYYDSNYDGTSQPLAQPVTILSVRLVKVMIIIKSDTGLVTMTTQISIRNLKDNL